MCDTFHCVHKVQAKKLTTTSYHCYIQPDNVDGYSNLASKISQTDQLYYNKWLASTGHSLGLAVGLKNCGGLISQLASSFDFSVVEQCNQYSECGTYSAMTAKGSPIFSIEYTKDTTATCNALNQNGKGLNGLLKNMALDAWAYDCSTAKQINN